MLFVKRHSLAKVKHLKGLLRAGGYFAALGLVLGAVQIRSARAEVKNRTVELGRQMLQLANATQHDMNRINLNGQTIFVGSSLAMDSPKAVLDRYEDYCQKNAAQSSDSWRDLATQPNGSKTDDKSGILAGGGVMRAAAGEGEGTVICFTKGESSKGTTREALSTFAETGELGALGGLRYVYVRPTEQGHTTVLTAWTDDKFNVTHLIPDGEKDSGGADFAGLPRPPSSQRLMSAMVEGTPFGVNIYKGGESPEKIGMLMDSEMTKRGWWALDPELQTRTQHDPTKPAPVGRLYEKDGMVLSVVATRDEGEVVTAFGLAGTTSTDGTKSMDGRKAIDMSPSERSSKP